jgi:hypothetical protein
LLRAKIVARSLRYGDSNILSQIWLTIEINTRQMRKLLAAQKIPSRIMTGYKTPIANPVQFDAVNSETRLVPPPDFSVTAVRFAQTQTPSQKMDRDVLPQL